MLNEHTLDQLRGLRLDGMVHAIQDQATHSAAAGLAFEERLIGLSCRASAIGAPACTQSHPDQLAACRLTVCRPGPGRLLRHCFTKY